MNRRQFGLSSLLSLFCLDAAKASQPTKIKTPVILLDTFDREECRPLIPAGAIEKFIQLPLSDSVPIRLGVECKGPDAGRVLGWEVQGGWLLAEIQSSPEVVQSLSSGGMCLRPSIFGSYTSKTWGRFTEITGFECLFTHPLKKSCWAEQQMEQFGTKGGTV